MITYTVHEAPQPPADRLDRAESLVFVKDGFNLWAAVITPLWLIANRLWLALVFYGSAIVLIEVLLWSLDVGQRPASILVGALHLIIGFEADTIRRWTLARHGWTQIASVNGRNAEDCQRRFFETWLPGIPGVQASALTGSSLVGSGAVGMVTGNDKSSFWTWRVPRLLGGSR